MTTDGKTEVTLTYQEARKQIRKSSSESNEDYVQRLSTIINQSISFNWSDEDIKKYNLTVPPYHNYLLYLGSYIRPEIFKKYEFCNPFRGLERGVGLCSQHAVILVGLLEGVVPARVAILNGHVVTEVHFDSKRIPYGL